LRVTDDIVRLVISRKFLETNTYLRWKKRDVLCRFYFYHFFKGKNIKKIRKLEDDVWCRNKHRGLNAVKLTHDRDHSNLAIVNYLYTGLSLLVQQTYILSLSNFNKTKNYSFSEFVQVIRKKGILLICGWLYSYYVINVCQPSDVKGGVR
jgi:hypothetical protein